MLWRLTLEGRSDNPLLGLAEALFVLMWRDYLEAGMPTVSLGPAAM